MVWLSFRPGYCRPWHEGIGSLLIINKLLKCEQHAVYKLYTCRNISSIADGSDIERFYRAVPNMWMLTCWRFHFTFVAAQFYLNKLQNSPQLPSLRIQWLWICTTMMDLNKSLVPFSGTTGSHSSVTEPLFTWYTLTLKVLFDSIIINYKL